MDTNTDDMELALDLDPAPDPDPDLPTPEAAGDPAAEAFTRLEGELALMRRAVQHLAAERADIAIPDYGATLTDMAKRMGAICEILKGMAGHPAMQMTPDSIGSRIAEAAETARRSDHDTISQARDDLHHATQTMRSVTANTRLAAAQRHQLCLMAGCGLLAGVLLWSALPGVVARAVPQSWHWPERMAVRVLREPTIVDAGIRLIRSQNPQMWEDITEFKDCGCEPGGDQALQGHGT